MFYLAPPSVAPLPSALIVQSCLGDPAGELSCVLANHGAARPGNCFAAAGLLPVLAG